MWQSSRLTADFTTHGELYSLSRATSTCPNLSKVILTHTVCHLAALEFISPSVQHSQQLHQLIFMILKKRERGFWCCCHKVMKRRGIVRLFCVLPVCVWQWQKMQCSVNTLAYAEYCFISNVSSPQPVWPCGMFVDRLKWTGEMLNRFMLHEVAAAILLRFSTFFVLTHVRILVMWSPSVLAYTCNLHLRCSVTSLHHQIRMSQYFPGHCHEQYALKYECHEVFIA